MKESAFLNIKQKGRQPIVPSSPNHLLVTYTAKNTVISPTFLVWKICGKAQFPHSFGRFTRNYMETVPFTNFPHHEIR